MNGSNEMEEHQRPVHPGVAHLDESERNALEVLKASTDNLRKAKEIESRREHDKEVNQIAFRTATGAFWREGIKVPGVPRIIGSYYAPRGPQYMLKSLGERDMVPPGIWLYFNRRDQDTGMTRAYITYAGESDVPVFFNPSRSLNLTTPTVNRDTRKYVPAALDRLNARIAAGEQSPKEVIPVVWGAFTEERKFNLARTVGGYLGNVGTWTLQVVEVGAARIIFAVCDSVNLNDGEVPEYKEPEQWLLDRLHIDFLEDYAPQTVQALGTFSFEGYWEEVDRLGAPNASVPTWVRAYYHENVSSLRGRLSYVRMSRKELLPDAGHYKWRIKEEGYRDPETGAYHPTLEFMFWEKGGELLIRSGQGRLFKDFPVAGTPIYMNRGE